MLLSICSHRTDGYLAGNVRSVRIRLGVIEGEEEDCVSWDALWEKEDYACAYVMRKRLKNLHVYEEEVGGLAFEVKAKERPWSWSPEKEIRNTLPIFYIRGGVFVWIFFQGGKQLDCGRDSKAVGPVGGLDCAGALGEGLQQRPGRGLELWLELPGVLISKDGMSSWSSRWPGRG